MSLKRNQIIWLESNRKNKVKISFSTTNYFNPKSSEIKICLEGLREISREEELVWEIRFKINSKLHNIVQWAWKILKKPSLIPQIIRKFREINKLFKTIQLKLMKECIKKIKL